MFRSSVANKALQVFLHSLEKIEYGSLNLTLPNGQSHYFAGNRPGPKATFQLHDAQVLLNMQRKGDTAFALDYQAGKWDSPDITSLIEASILNYSVMQPYIGNRFNHVLLRMFYFFQSNTKRGSKKNILSHYDLGNAFYETWLDPSMTYSSGIYLSEEDSLETAQQQKYDRILAQLPSTSQSILEIGCGWGGFAERALSRTNHHLYSITISDAQFAYAQKRLSPFSSRANIRLEDYRDLQQQFDAIVSIEMFEAVGEKYWPTYFSAIQAALKPQGKAVIQTITIDEPYFERYRKSGDAIRSLIFPGGMLPSPSAFMQAANQAQLSVGEPYFFGQSYAQTLLQWLDNFDSATPKILSMGFDEAFIRLWRFYLCYCAGGFRSGRINVMQTVLQHQHEGKSS